MTTDPDQTFPDLAFEDALIERVRPAFARADAEWLLDEEEVIDLLVETGGDAAWLARELNDQGDCCALTWLPKHAGLSEPMYASFRRYALALKATAAVLDQRRDPR